MGVAAIAVAQGLVLGASPVAAQGVSAERTLSFNIPAGSVRDALRAYADATGLQLVYNASLDTAGASTGVSGTMTPRDALARLLAGTGLSYRFVNATTVTIENAVTADGERVLGAVRVEGAQDGAYGRAGQAAGVNGVNGSRDITATEGTGSYTSGALTIGSKAPQSIKDTPQSVSVLTQQRMQDQNLTNYTAALDQTPGIALAQGESNLQTTFYSRGFTITSIQVDGGAPLLTGLADGNGSGFIPQIDMAIYDHVEMLRGAAGLFNGYGDPSGTVNLVRKKPLSQPQLIIEAQAGSWNTYRAMMDASAPLGLEGKLRGRFVTVYQDNEHFYRIAEDNRTVVYGVLEYDLTPSTLVTAGGSFTHQTSIPWSGGLPRYQNGDDLELPRNTCLCFSWNRWKFETTEFFGSVEQKISDAWTIKASFTRNEQNSDRKVGYSSGSVIPATGQGPVLSGALNKYAINQLAADIIVSGRFGLFGREHKVVAGFNHSNTDGAGRMNYGQLYPVIFSAGAPYYGRPPIDVFAFDPTDPAYVEPRSTLPTERYLQYGQEQSGAFINLDLNLLARLHLIAGFRQSWFKYKNEAQALCTTTTQAGCAGKAIGEPADPTGGPSLTEWSGSDSGWPPNVSLLYEVTDSLSAYFGYTDVYISQSRNLDRELKPLQPITGSNIEGGLKWQSPGGRLNVSLSAYYIKQENFATEDLDALFVNEDGSYGYVDNFGNRYLFGQLEDGERSCCWKNNPERKLSSKGVDLEVTGELRPGWQIFLGYTYNKNKYSGQFYVDQSLDGEPLVSLQPEHLLKLWTSYVFAEGSALPGITIGGGLKAQSKVYQAGTACSEFIVNPNTGAVSCRPGFNLPYDYTANSYAILSARVDYRITKNWTLALNVNNMTDKRYYQTMGTNSGGNWYGEPRSATLTLRGKW